MLDIRSMNGKARDSIAIVGYYGWRKSDSLSLITYHRNVTFSQNFFFYDCRGRQIQRRKLCVDKLFINKLYCNYFSVSCTL